MPKPDTQTPTKTDAPTRRQDEPAADPERHYNPERLCPSQRKDGTRWSMP
jgi:hypothetical protein